MTDRPAMIFDFGNVVAHFDFARSGERLGQPLGLSGPEFVEIAKEAGLGEVLKVYESGGMDSEEFHRRVCSLTRIEPTFDAFATDWGDIFTPNEPVHAILRELKRLGYPLFLGSNTNELHARHFRRQFEAILGLFDGLILSYEVGRIKPDSGFFGACAAVAGRPPRECVFIDDLVENVEAARSAGMIGLVYRDTAGLIEELRGLGVKLSLL